MSKVVKIGSALGVATLLGISGAAQADAGNPFGFNPLSSGYMQVAENKCGEGKCGAKPTADKAKEGKCGEGKCGAKPTADKAKEGKCGEGKCGSKK